MAIGMGFSELQFGALVPPFPAIKAAFQLQTGLDLSLGVELNVSTLTTEPAEIHALLEKSKNSVSEAQAEREAFHRAHPNDYEAWAEYRDKVYSKQMGQLDYLSNVRFKILDFYELDFHLNENVLTIESYPSQYYGVVSLTKVLEDLGGQNLFYEGTHPKNLEKYRRLRQRRKQKLKQWHEYKWYNRPRK